MPSPRPRAVEADASPERPIVRLQPVSRPEKTDVDGPVPRPTKTSKRSGSGASAASVDSGRAALPKLAKPDSDPTDEETARIKRETKNLLRNNNSATATVDQVENGHLRRLLGIPRGLHLMSRDGATAYFVSRGLPTAPSMPLSDADARHYKRVESLRRSKPADALKTVLSIEAAEGLDARGIYSDADLPEAPCRRCAAKTTAGRAHGKRSRSDASVSGSSSSSSSSDSEGDEPVPRKAIKTVASGGRADGRTGPRLKCTPRKQVQVGNAKHRSRHASPPREESRSKRVESESAGPSAPVDRVRQRNRPVAVLPSAQKVRRQLRTLVYPGGAENLAQTVRFAVRKTLGEADSKRSLERGDLNAVIEKACDKIEFGLALSIPDLAGKREETDVVNMVAGALSLLSASMQAAALTGSVVGVLRHMPALVKFWDARLKGAAENGLAVPFHTSKSLYEAYMKTV
ncbi:MAG: hypothetical protein DIZ80_02535 [endosymbiont of Galathealinum brachiosum]|uniref:Uncharacterized protein n=1 Tax=endosymbiont of Galathealinum brachiosum TaxID=2200906 RepID=A0A370DK26_9GAMM|nr:MAG: hypothetical protein DIZ80_02535 [endosymbiont of Galathealinum brachiosum]